MRLSAVLLPALLAGSLATQEENWLPVAESADHTIMTFIDINNLSEERNTMIIWVKYLYIDHSYTIVLEQFDCKNIRSRRLEQITYTPSGYVALHKQWASPKWKSIVPGTNGEVVRKFVCQLRGR